MKLRLSVAERTVVFCVSVCLCVPSLALAVYGRHFTQAHLVAAAAAALNV